MSLTQAQLADKFKNYLLAQNSAINVTRKGNYFDITANAIAGVLKEVYDYSYQNYLASTLESFNIEILEDMLDKLQLSPRKQGVKASGKVIITGGAYPLTVNEGDVFTLGSMNFYAEASATINADGEMVDVVAESIGAEYNNSEVSLGNALGVTATSFGIRNGSALETIYEIIERIRLYAFTKKTRTTKEDILSMALEYCSMCRVATAFTYGDVIPYGSKIILAGTISDYDVAASSPTLVDVSVDTDVLIEFEKVAKSWHDVTIFNDICSESTQELPTIDISLIVDDNLTATEMQNIYRAIRKQILLFDTNNNNYFSPSTLDLNFKNPKVIGVQFTNNYAVQIKSMQLDCININLTEILGII